MAIYATNAKDAAADIGVHSIDSQKQDASGKNGRKKIAKCEYFWRQIVGEPPPPNVQNLLPQNDF